MTTEEHNLVLILARGLASSIATPMMLVDPDGTVVYFNEPAEAILGESYAEVGELTRDEFIDKFYTGEDQSGTKVPPAELPIGVALGKRRPAHRTLTVARADGERRAIAVTAFPLFARTEELAGALAIFWEEE
ncbi:MAG: PAS domain-containing protein [Actinomycetota bacterium]|nr:PAS domain-containing protein [Actinomycetota bacterium]